MTVNQPSILITGATSGIGRQLTVDYLQLGHTVYAVGRNEQALEQLKMLGAETIQLDLTNREEVIVALSQIQSLDVVICCAGMCRYVDFNYVNSNYVDSNNDVNHPCQHDQSKLSAEPNKLSGINGFDGKLIMDVFNTNVGSLVYTIEATLPALKKSKGRLVALGSASAFVPFQRAEAYGSSKAAVHYLMKTLQISLKPYDIGVSLAIPGFVNTPMTSKNDFDMPFIQTPKQASLAIRDGIKKQQEIIEFPKRLTVPLKTFGILPDMVWQKVSDKLYK